MLYHTSDQYEDFTTASLLVKGGADHKRVWFVITKKIIYHISVCIVIRNRDIVWNHTIAVLLIYLL